MGNCKVKTLSRRGHPSIVSSTANKSIFTMGHQIPATTSTTNLVRWPVEISTQLRRLHEAEIITLFTPLVPHSPSTTLAKDMDPFEPLGRALPRRVRHVPYRLDRGMTETHADFLPASGAVLIVICATEHIVSGNPQSFEQQVKFARGVLRAMEKDASMMKVPVVLLLMGSSDMAGQMHSKTMQDFPALVTINDYTTATFSDTVGVLFGK